MIEESMKAIVVVAGDLDDQAKFASESSSCCLQREFRCVYNIHNKHVLFSMACSARICTSTRVSTAAAHQKRISHLRLKNLRFYLLNHSGHRGGTEEISISRTFV